MVFFRLRDSRAEIRFCSRRSRRLAALVASDSWGSSSSSETSSFTESSSFMGLEDMGWDFSA